MIIYYQIEVKIHCSSPWHNGMNQEEAKKILWQKDADKNPLLKRTLPKGYPSIKPQCIPSQRMATLQRTWGNHNVPRVCIHFHQCCAQAHVFNNYLLILLFANCYSENISKVQESAVGHSRTLRPIHECMSRKEGSEKVRAKTPGGSHHAGCICFHLPNSLANGFCVDEFLLSFSPSLLANCIMPW